MSVAMEGSKERQKCTTAVIAHVDMDCFYCAVERGLDPTLNGVAMAVAQYNPFGDLATVLPSDNRRVKTNGSLIAVSYEARAAGVKRSMRGNEACQACPELVLVQVPVAYGKADIGIYRDAGDRVVQVLSKRYKCIVEKASVDEVYLDVTEEASRLLARCRPSCAAPACGSSSSKSDDTIESNSSSPLDFCSDILAHTKVLLGGEDQQELLLGKKHLSKGYDNADFLASGSAISSEMKSSSDVSENSGNGGEETTGAPSSTAWLTRPPHVWELPENQSEQLLVCGAFLVQQLRKDLFDQTGYTSSAGIAHTKILAKVASAMHKPNKMTVVPSSIVPSLMKSLPLNRLKGFGGKLGDDLKEHFNIETAGDLIEVGEQRLAAKYPDRSQVQNVAWMMAMARGEVYEPVKPVVAAQIISCGKTFRGKMSLPASSLLDGQVMVWIIEMAKELVGRLDDMALKHDMYPGCIGTTTCVQASPRSSSSVNVSKNSAIPTQAKLPGGSYNPAVLAQQALSLIKSAVEKSSKIPSVTTENDKPAWVISAIFLNATGFTKRVSEKQSISSFFKASSPNKKLKADFNKQMKQEKQEKQEKMSTTTTVTSTINNSPFSSLKEATLGKNDSLVLNDKKNSPKSNKKRTLLDCFDNSTSTKGDEKVQLPDGKDDRADISQLRSCPIEPECESSTSIRVPIATCSNPSSLSAPSTTTATSKSCNVSVTMCEVGRTNKNVGDKKDGDTGDPYMTDQNKGMQLGGEGDIDMEVFQNLPSDIQEELAAAYNIQVKHTSGSSLAATTTVSSSSEAKCNSRSGSSTVKVSKGVTVDSIISERVKEKERKKRESSGMHIYFQKKR